MKKLGKASSESNSGHRGNYSETTKCIINKTVKQAASLDTAGSVFALFCVNKFESLINLYFLDFRLTIFNKLI